MQFDSDLIEKWNNCTFDDDPNIKLEDYDLYGSYASTINNTSAKLFEKTYTLSHNGNTILRYGDILVGYQSNNIEPINVALTMNGHIINTFTLTNNKYVPAIFSTHYLPLICLQYTECKLVLINDDIKNNINIKLIYAGVSSANRRQLAQLGGQMKLKNSSIFLIEMGEAKWCSDELNVLTSEQQLNLYNTYTPFTNI
jgi:hypothetical protein